MAIQDKAMLASLTVRKWTGTRVDKAVTQEVHQAHGAGRDAGRYSKRLLNKEAWADIQKAESAARAAHYEQTLPWGDDGARILPAANFKAYSAEINRCKTKYEIAVDAFLIAYPGWIDEARIRLGDMFDRDLYPGEAELRRAFGFGVEVMPLPAGADFRVELSADEVSRIQREIEGRVSDGVAAAHRDLWERLRERVQYTRDRLVAFDNKEDGSRVGVFRDSLVENIRDLCEIAPRLNLTGDATFAALVEDVKETVAAFDADVLRDDQYTRKDVIESADDILARMAGYTGTVAPIAAE